MRAMQDYEHGFRLSDFTENEFDHLEYVITESMSKGNPMEWMEGYIQGLLQTDILDSDKSDELLLDIFWSYLWQGGGEHTTPGHIGLGAYTTTDCALEVINHLIESERFQVDELLDYINKNMSKR